MSPLLGSEEDLEQPASSPGATVPRWVGNSRALFNFRAAQQHPEGEMPVLEVAIGFIPQYRPPCRSVSCTTGPGVPPPSQRTAHPPAASSLLPVWTGTQLGFHLTGVWTQTDDFCLAFTEDNRAGSILHLSCTRSPNVG